MNRDSEKSAKFQRIAERRVTETIRKMRLIGNLANRNNYSYTDEHVRQIIDALEAELRQVKSRFQQGPSAQSPSFSFKR